MRGGRSTLRMSRSSGCCERQAQERQRVICAVAMGSLTRDLLQLEGAIWRHSAISAP